MGRTKVRPARRQIVGENPMDLRGPSPYRHVADVIAVRAGEGGPVPLTVAARLEQGRIAHLSIRGDTNGNERWGLRSGIRRVLRQECGAVRSNKARRVSWRNLVR